jgi:hypothetical protein
VLGVREGQLLEETHLGAAHLGQTLSTLYGVNYVDASLPGGLAVDLDSPDETEAK